MITPIKPLWPKTIEGMLKLSITMKELSYMRPAGKGEHDSLYFDCSYFLRAPYGTKWCSRTYDFWLITGAPERHATARTAIPHWASIRSKPACPAMT